MTITDPTAAPANTIEIQPVAVDLYRDIHKGIRAELFALTLDAGRLDPSDAAGRADLAVQVGTVFDVLVSHAEHEDAAIQPVLEDRLPALAARIASAHATIEARMVELRGVASEVATATGDSRVTLHRLYLELAVFTRDYLAHQDDEERVVMPALEAAVGVERVGELQLQIVTSIPPEEMVQALAFMLPAMNVDDRAELLGGMRAGAPAEAFAGIWSLAGSVLPPADHAALAVRLGIA